MTISIAATFEHKNAFLQREIAIFPFKRILFRFLDWLLEANVKSLNSLLDEAYTTLQGALVVIQDYSQEEAAKDLPLVRKGIRLFTKYQSMLGKADYLDSVEVKSKIDLVISTFYDAELQLKKKAFSGKHGQSADSDLLDELSIKSKQALRGTF